MPTNNFFDTSENCSLEINAVYNMSRNSRPTVR